MYEAQEERPTHHWGPDACQAVVSVTFDNLGEAADLERGLWPEDEPLGRHFSVKRTLPRILGILEELGLRSTFYVEGASVSSTTWSSCLSWRNRKAGSRSCAECSKSYVFS
jgi:peptidoglycan/xylan/chitin deacetylase (PgdA/CDA1 family)